MISTKLNHDNNSYKEAIKQSVAPGNYYLRAPFNKICYASNPELIFQNDGNHISKNIDVSSELKGLSRKLSTDPAKQYNPNKQRKYKRHFKNCKFPSTEYTSLSNPSCTLRGTELNRWDWLCKNPQENVIPQLKMKMNVNESLNARDNYVSCTSTLLKKN